MTCQAKQYSDNTMRCERCNLTWDIDDERPECLTAEEIGNRSLDAIKKELDACCGTTCDKNNAAKALLFARRPPTLYGALLAEPGDKTEALAEFVADCMLREDWDDLHINGPDFLQALDNYLKARGYG